MALIRFRDVSFGFAGPPLLDGVSFQIEAGERVCLLGRNGTGKSTLLRLVAGVLQPEMGIIDRKRDARVGLLEQEVPDALPGSVAEVVATGLSKDGLGQEQHQVDEAISRIGIDPVASFATLSAGLKRRVFLARALVRKPDLLLLDEPTNHLDIDAIHWLEGFLGRFPGALLFITHDRALVRRVATRIIQLDSGALYSFPGNYDSYQKRREQAVQSELRQQAEFDKKLAREEVWLRQGIKARRTRNEGRKRSLEKMRQQRKARRERLGNVRFSVQQAERSGKLVIEARQATVAYDAEPILHDISTIICRGDKVGIIGPNNCGKTTLLKTLLGELKPMKGEVRLGTRLEVAYFDQLRMELDDSKTVAENITGGGDTITIDGSPRHVLGYLERFLFAPERSRGPVTVLSGGERNRLLLARLFAQASNLLVLDEPTNDLDVETLELLEQCLIDYDGTVLVVSHDRDFLDNVVTSSLCFEGRGRFIEYAGGYSDWQQQASASEPATKLKAPEPQGAKGKPRRERPRRLSFKERQELEGLPARLEDVEQKLEACRADMGDPAFYRRGSEEIAAAKLNMEKLELLLDEVYSRWQELEDIAANET